MGYINFLTSETRAEEITDTNATVIWQPDYDKQLFVQSIQFTVDAAAEVMIWFSDDTGYGSGDTIIKWGDFAANSGVDSVYRWPIAGAPTQPLVAQTSAGNLKIVVTGIEQ